MTWKLGDFIDPPSKQQVQANDPHEGLKYWSQYRVVISFYVIKNFGLATELEA